MADVLITYLSVGRGTAVDGALENVTAGLLASAGAPLVVTATPTAGDQRPLVPAPPGGGTVVHVELLARGATMKVAECHPVDGPATVVAAATTPAAGAGHVLADGIPKLIPVRAGNRLSFVTVA